MTIKLIQQIHLTFVGISLLAFFLALLFSSFYLVQQWQLKQKKSIGFFPFVSSLEALDRYVVRCLVVASLSMTVLVITGIILAHVKWDKDWLSDKRFIIAFLTWIWCILTLLFRFRAGWRGKRFFYSIGIGMIFLVASCILAMGF